MKEFELHQQKIIETDHVVNFVDGEYEHKPKKKLREGKLTSKTIPNRDHTNTQYHENAEHHECPSDDPRIVKQFFFSWQDHLLGLLCRLREKPLILNESHC